MATEIESVQTSPAQGGNDSRGNTAMYSLMRDVLSEQEQHQNESIADQTNAAELRRSKRKKFTCIQLIAPYDGRRMPSQAEFQPQLCHDLSPTGFSFWQQKAVALTHLIVALGEAPFLFFVAEIVHQAYERLGEPGGWRIGCRFIRRVER
jgi:hypothetical protein